MMKKIIAFSLKLSSCIAKDIVIILLVLQAYFILYHYVLCKEANDLF